MRLIVLFSIVMLILAISGCVERLVFFPMRGTPQPPLGVPVEDVYFDTEDGLRLHGWFLPAVTTATGAAATRDQTADEPLTPARAGTILMFHGNAGNVEHHVGFVEFLPAAGFNVFVFDYRGYGLSERGRLRRDPIMQDARAALAMLRARSDVDPHRIAIYSHSLGGMFGLALLAEEPDLRGGVVVSPFTSLPDAAASVISPWEPPGAVARWLGRLLLRSGLDPVDSIIRMHPGQAVLVVHGENDEVVPVHHGERLAAVGEAAGVDVRFLPIAGGDHNSLRWLDPGLDATMVAFYQRLLDRRDDSAPDLDSKTPPNAPPSSEDSATRRPASPGP